MGINYYHATSISTISTDGFALRIPIAKHYSDQWERKPVLRFASLLLTCTAVPAFIILSRGRDNQILIVQLELNIVFGIYFSVIHSFHYCRAISSSCALSWCIFGPQAGGKPLALITPVIYLALGVLVSFCATFGSKRVIIY